MMVNELGSPMCLVPLTNLRRLSQRCCPAVTEKNAPSLLGVSVLKCNEHVIDWENFVVHTLRFVSMTEAGFGMRISAH
jgi:hypothetical protein